MMITDTSYQRIDALPIPTPFHDSSSGHQLQGRIALVGLPGVGRKRLFNSLLGWQAVKGSAERTNPPQRQTERSPLRGIETRSPR